MRQINGCLNRVPQHFYKDVWHILHRAPGGIRIGGGFIPQEPTITNMTSTDAGFSHAVENMISSNYLNPTRKQLVAELFCVLAAILKRNPELECCGSVDVDSLIKDALNMYRVVSTRKNTQ